MSISHMAGIASLAECYDAFIIDPWALLHNGDNVYPNALKTLRSLQELGKKVIFLTNEPRRVDVLIERLEVLGVAQDLYCGLVSSGEIVHYDLKTRSDAFFSDIGWYCYHLGPNKHSSVLEGLPYAVVTDLIEADFVLNTGSLFADDKIEAYLPTLRECLSKGIPMVCADPDLIEVQAGIQCICAGTISAKYEELGGEVVYRGKPDKNVFLYCLDGAGITDASRAVVIGDSPETDIRGANETGIDAVFVAGGRYARNVGASFDNIGNTYKIAEFLGRNSVSAKIVIPSIAW
ncbi:MAG: TIGR01459 family HAD-type hydrolase [Alphaproteobacteria bacterium]|nr:TIGR01459 family HAD-type hydrolase [Alphaproteobacteria bacterium]